jgi:protoporphyrinogen IX oxidase
MRTRFVDFVEAHGNFRNNDKVTHGTAVMTYLWIKSFHLLFVIAWMATVFYLPRIVVNLAEAGEDASVRARLLLMGRRLYKFGHNMFGVAFLFGLVLWQGWRVFPRSLPNVAAGMHWIDLKLGLVAVLLAYFVLVGRLLKRSEKGGALPSATALRWLNELPVLLLLGVIFLVLAKPF